MPRITAQNWRILVKVFEKYGCAYKRKHGSHHVLTYPGRSFLTEGGNNET
jgi:predicted RNA binding protein YcfA (HicA-like mRNA interferase family)